MRDRWLPVGVLAVILFAINAIARFVVWLAASNSAKKQTMIGLVAVIAVAVAMIVAGYLWGRWHPVPRALADLAVAIAAGCLLSVLVGPFAGGSAPLREGGNFFFAEIWHYLVLAAVGGGLGLLVVIAAGQDHKSQALRRFVRSSAAKPRRPVRR